MMLAPVGTEEIKTVLDRRAPGLCVRQFEPPRRKKLRHQGRDLLCQECPRPAGDEAIIGPPDHLDFCPLPALEPRASSPDMSFHTVQGQVHQDRRCYTSYKVANMLVEFSTSIPRTQLRPGYGDGFLGAPLQMRQALENPAPREQGEQRGSSTTPSQQNPGGAPYV